MIGTRARPAAAAPAVDASSPTCAATMPLALEVRNLRAGYAGREILKGVSFDVAPTDFFAIIGPSGAASRR